VETALVVVVGVETTLIAASVAEKVLGTAAVGLETALGCRRWRGNGPWLPLAGVVAMAAAG
jgi:hypothetical protein